MNVLVYAGPEVLPQSLSRSLSLLQSVLRPNYAVQTITPQSLATHPWTSSCALLVFPACTHLALPSPPLRSAVREYVERGGALLALAARLTKQTHIPTDDTLYFYDKYAGSNYTLASTKSTDGLVEGPVNLAQGKAIERLLHYPSPVLEDSVRAEDRIVLGTFGGGRIADAILHISGGKVAVFAQSLETTAPASTLIESETRALALPTLTQLGLSIPDEAAAAEKNGRVPRAPLPQFLVGNPAVPGVVGRVMSALESVLASSSEGEGGRIIKDTHDTFLFHAHTPEHTALLLREGRSREEEEVERAVRHIVVCDTPPTSEETPLFDLHAFFDALNAARTASGTIPTPWAMGDALLYGEAVTSTQTLLDKNPTMLSTLPTPLLSLASVQLTGRGRGANTWLSPAGCLQFSLLLRAPLAALPGSKVVFVQYLFALAVAEACALPSVLGADVGARVRIKWPNDIYIETHGPGGRERRKVGGILVHTSFSGSQVEMVVGCGLNTLNEPPIASLVSLLDEGSERARISMERTAAAIMATFEGMWRTFVAGRGSFEPFMDRYLERWLHSDQLVTLTTTTPHIPVRIVGITPEHGLLRTLPERPTGGWSNMSQPQFIDLQPDGNSFDIMAGLIRSKN